MASADTPAGVSNATPAPIVRTITVSPPTSSVTANVGDTVVVNLTACAASCGYRWAITTQPSTGVVRYLSTSFIDQPHPAGMVGGNQTQRVTFGAVGAGTTAVVLAYMPPGVGAAAAQTYRLTFEVASPWLFSTAQKRASGTAAQTAQLWRIRTSNAGSYDRVVFDQRNGVSGYVVRYVPRVVADPSGLPVTMTGRYFLQVTMFSTTTTGTMAAPTYVSSVISTHLPRVQQVRKVGEFEQVVTFGLGLRQYREFRVLQMTNPDRLVVDVRH